MAKQPDLSRAIMASTTALPRTTSTTQDWDDRSALCDEVALHTFTADVGQPCLQARGPHIAAQRDKPYWTTEQISRVAALPRQKIAAHDPLLRHIALLLQTVIGGKDEVGQLFAAVLIDALVAHFIWRSANMRLTLDQASGGLAPSKLRRTVAYIQNHLEQKLSLATLASVAQTSPAHFARLFKQATGRTPHQYVITCRMAYAKRLLVETDMPLSEIAPQVGCADQGHFTALLRKHVSMPPWYTETPASCERMAAYG